MDGKRKPFSDAPRRSRQPAPQRLRMENGRDDASNSSEQSGAFDSDATYSAEDERTSGSDGAGNAGSSGDSDSNMTIVSDYSEGANLAGDLGELNIQVPAEGEEPAAADGQHEEAEVPPAAANGQHEAEVPPPPPVDQPAAADVADQSVPAAAPAPEMGVPAAEPLCLGCRREPALERLVPVKHACLGLTCRSYPAGGPRCEVCDGLRH
ncbi:unnamed protein product [Alopecurus aequalis]